MNKVILFHFLCMERGPESRATTHATPVRVTTHITEATEVHSLVRKTICALRTGGGFLIAAFALRVRRGGRADGAKF